MKRGRSILLPKWSDKHGWRGGEKNRVYAFTDLRTGSTRYYAQHGFYHVGAGPGVVSVRPARLAEVQALADWEGPLFPKAGLPGGWKVV